MLKVLLIAQNYPKLPKIAKNGQKQPLLVHNFVLNWDIYLIFYYIPEGPTNKFQNWPQYILYISIYKF